MAILLGESTQNPLIVRTGVTQPSLYYSITNTDGSPADMEGSTVSFLMRLFSSRNPVIDSAAVPLFPPDNDGNNVRYDWQSSDVSLEGQYSGWFSYQLSGSSSPAETDEFAIVISDHGPGFGSETGAIVDTLSQWLPTTVDHLRADPQFGDRFLQRHADYVKQIVMGTVVPVDQEILYNPFLIDYLSKRTVVRLILPAKEYWARQPQSLLTSGPAEQSTYPNMLNALDALKMQLEKELASDWLQLQQIVPGLPQLTIEHAPASSFGPSSPWNQPVSRSPQQTLPAQTGGPRWDAWFTF